MNMQSALVPLDKPKSLIAKFAERFGVEPDKMLATLKATAFRQRDNAEITNEQMMGLLIVADQYGLNPWTKEIFAFSDKGAIVPIVSVDGWARIINSNRDFDGVEFNYSDKMATMPDGKPCPEWCEATIHHKSRSHPTVIREYLDEVYIPKRNNYAGPWQSHTKRFLRHKTLIQGARVAFGFAGIYDEDEGHRIVDATRVQDATSKVSHDFTEFTTKLEQTTAKQQEVEVALDVDFIEEPVIVRDVIDETVPVSGDPTLADAKLGIESATTLEALDDSGALLSAFKADPTHKDVVRLYLEKRAQLIDT